jgi:hypothetical protein
MLKLCVPFGWAECSAQWITLPCYHVFRVNVTNNNGFWIRWLDLLALLYNYSQFKQAGHWKPSEWITTPVWRMLYEGSLKNPSRDWIEKQSRASSSLLLATSQHGHSWHRAPLGPMAIYLFNIKNIVNIVNRIHEWTAFITAREPNRDHHLQGFRYALHECVVSETVC